MIPFRFQTQLLMRWSDLDAFKHVNNATYLTYLEEARILYLDQVCKWDWQEVSMLVAKVIIDYKKPLLWGENYVVSIACTRLGNTSFDLSYRIFKQNNPDLIFAEALTVMVSLSTKSLQPISIPLNYRDLIDNFENQSHDSD